MVLIGCLNLSQLGFLVFTSSCSDILMTPVIMKKHVYSLALNRFNTTIIALIVRDQKAMSNTKDSQEKK